MGLNYVSLTCNMSENNSFQYFPGYGWIEVLMDENTTLTTEGGDDE
jgi:hypothetical protein